MIHRLTDNEQYRSFLDDRTGDVIIQVWIYRGWEGDSYYEAIIRPCGKVDFYEYHRKAIYALFHKIDDCDSVSLKDADDYLRGLAKRDKENANV